MEGFNDSEQIPIKGDSKKTNSPGLASGYNEPAQGMPGGNPKSAKPTGSETVPENINDYHDSNYL